MGKHVRLTRLLERFWRLLAFEGRRGWAVQWSNHFLRRRLLLLLLPLRLCLVLCTAFVSLLLLASLLTLTHCSPGLQWKAEGRQGRPSWLRRTHNRGSKATSRGRFSQSILQKAFAKRSRYSRCYSWLRLKVKTAAAVLHTTAPHHCSWQMKKTQSQIYCTAKCTPFSFFPS